MQKMATIKICLTINYFLLLLVIFATKMVFAGKETAGDGGPGGSSKLPSMQELNSKAAFQSNRMRKMNERSAEAAAPTKPSKLPKVGELNSRAKSLAKSGGSGSGSGMANTANMNSSGKNQPESQKTASKLPRLSQLNRNYNRGKPRCECGKYVLSRMEDFGAVHKDYLKSRLSFGSGAQGQVYHGYNKRLKKCVAIKMLNIEGQDEYTRINFETEFMASKFIKNFGKVDLDVHRRIVNIFDVYKDSKKIVIFMELGLMTAENYWDKILDADYTYQQKVILGRELVMKMVKSFITLHSIGIMHLDFKCSNIVLSNDPLTPNNYLVKLIDFGAARTVISTKDDAKMNAPVKTIYPIRTLEMCAPEQLNAAYDEDADQYYVKPTTKSDIWAIGSSILFMFTRCLTGEFFKEDKADESSMIALAQWLAKNQVINAHNGPLLHMALACLHLKPERRPMAFQLIAYLSNWCTMGLSSIYQQTIGLKPQAYDGSDHKPLCITMSVEQYHQIIERHNKLERLNTMLKGFKKDAGVITGDK